MSDLVRDLLPESDAIANVTAKRRRSCRRKRIRPPIERPYRSTPDVASGAIVAASTRLTPRQKLRQLGDIRRDPPRTNKAANRAALSLNAGHR